MVISRASTQWSSRLYRQSLRGIRSNNRSRSWQKTSRRTYASEGSHDSHQKSAFAGDLPWALTSLAVTIPSVWYLMQPQIDRYTGKKGGHGGHGNHEHEESEDNEHHEGDSDKDAEAEGGTSEDAKAGESSEATQEAEESEKGPKEGDEESTSNGPGRQGANKSGPDTPSDKGPKDFAHETESGGNVEGVQFKGATSGGTRDGEQGDTRKHIPDAKGGSKKRIESAYAIKLGESQEPQQDPSNEDLGAAAKPVGNKSTQSGKQEGLSNTDTKHSTDIVSNPDKSTKPTGAPETAKEKGTVDPRRPQS